MKTFRIRMLATIAMVGLALPTLAQQLPELTAATATGANTSAKFFGGVSADNGASFGNSFDFDTRLNQLVGDILNSNEKHEFAKHAFNQLRNLLFNQGE